MKKSRLISEVDVTYIVSAYNRPVMLPVVLWSIKGQSQRNFECFVTDNSTDPKMRLLHQQAVTDLRDKRFIYVHTAPKIKVSDCYHAAEYVMAHFPMGRWLCFPCDDTYLMPDYARRLLTIGTQEEAGFVYCKYVVVGPDAGGAAMIGTQQDYRIWEQRPYRTCKTCFMVRRDVFNKFEGKMDTPGYFNADYWVSGQMVQRGIKIASVPDILVVHN